MSICSAGFSSPFAPYDPGTLSTTPRASSNSRMDKRLELLRTIHSSVNRVLAIANPPAPAGGFSFGKVYICFFGLHWRPGANHPQLRGRGAFWLWTESEGRVTVGDKKEGVGQNSIVPAHYPHNEVEQHYRITTCKQYGKPGNDYEPNHCYP